MPNNTINSEDWRAALDKSGFRMTTVQETLIDIFARSEYPLSAEQAWEVARQSRPKTGRATVYRMVEKLESLGLIRRVHGYQGCSHFVPTLPELMMLFICLDCGRADYLDSQPLAELIQQSERVSGHHITDSRLQLFGACADCQQNA
ncbi:MAG: transcriptional repressor [Chloroflexota bacterium]|nr:transcriptional repressor [Chloroflexota bacterium]MDE2950701.1 transcriptional repressor [Chloroflexota bacterium]